MKKMLLMMFRAVSRLNPPLWELDPTDLQVIRKIVSN